MGIQREIETGLRIFGLHPGLDPERSAAWKLLSPHMDRVARNLVDVAISQIPFYASALEANAAGVIERIVRCTGNLFTRPYDETWLAETIERMEYEQTHGFDVRARIAVNRLILSDFTRVLARRYRFFGARGAARHMDIATRVLLHDGSLAANLHFAGNMRKARGTSEDLTRSLETFELATVETRTSVSKGAECLRGTSQNLRMIFDAIGNEAARAVEASVATATDVQEAAGATDRLSFAIEELEHKSASSTAYSSRKLCGRRRPLSACRGALGFQDLNDAEDDLTIFDPPEPVGFPGKCASLAARDPSATRRRTTWRRAVLGALLLLVARGALKLASACSDRSSGWTTRRRHHDTG